MYCFLANKGRESLQVIYEKMGFRFYTPFQIQSSGRNLFYVEVWLEKPRSQESLQDQKRIPLWFLWQQAEWVWGSWEWVEGQPQSYLALGLGSLEPWLPLGHIFPQSFELRPHRNFLDSGLILIQRTRGTVMQGLEYSTSLRRKSTKLPLCPREDTRQRSADPMSILSCH